MKTINKTENVFNIKSANGTGFNQLHQANSWLDRGARLFDNGLTVEAPDDNFTVTYEEQTYNIESNVLLGAALFEGIQGKGESITGLLELYQSGFIAKAQQRYSESDKKTAAKETGPFEKAGTLITAAQYLHNCITLGLDVKNIDTVQELVLKAYTKELDKFTKTELAAMLSDLVQVFLSADSYDVYNVKIDSEAASAKKFKALIDAGYTDIQGIAIPGRYNAKLSMQNLSKIGLLLEHGFILIGTVPSGDGFQINFKEVEQVEEPEADKEPA